ncbi:unnamed protein product [Mytilus edulis]|uniref:Uncharacterized protein n=1 Tax=Mytilus edulis TaxID=6550 RepID=A0A8S3TX49_MYTED|nr:unnamed protein product [Mytilus edulis]
MATPFWLTVSIPDDFAAKVYIQPSKLQIDLLETNHYLGLWQWCFGGNGCIDLGLIFKFGSEKEYQYQWEKDSYEKVKKIIGYWIATRVFAAIGFISGVLVTIMLLWFICRGTGNNHCLGRTVIGCFVTGGFLVISVAVFGSGIYNNSDMFRLHRFDIYHHLSYWIATRVFAAGGFISGVLVTIMLLWFISRGTGNSHRQGRTVIGCFVTGAFLVISVAVFSSGIYNNSDMFYLNLIHINHHLSFSFGMTCIAAILYTVIETVLICMLCTGDYERSGRHRRTATNGDAFGKI